MGPQHANAGKGLTAVGAERGKAGALALFGRHAEPGLVIFAVCVLRMQPHLHPVGLGLQRRQSNAIGPGRATLAVAEQAGIGIQVQLEPRGDALGNPGRQQPRTAYIAHAGQLVRPSNTECMAVLGFLAVVLARGIIASPRRSFVPVRVSYCKPSPRCGSI